jgi:hypothetical protein
MKFIDLTDKRYCNCDVLYTVIWAHRSSFHLSQGGLSFIGRFVFYREICLLQGGLSFIGRFVFHREVCLSQGGLSFIGRFVFHREVCLSQGGLSFTVTSEIGFHPNTTF